MVIVPENIFLTTKKKSLHFFAWICSTKRLLFLQVHEYQILKKSLHIFRIDAPCGGMAWMPSCLRKIANVTSKKISFFGRKKFKYLGVDIVDSLINASRSKYSATEPNWSFLAADFGQPGSLPDNYDLVFSRDALQHLPYKKIFAALRTFASLKKTKYLLVGSYLDSPTINQNIEAGSYFDIDLTKSPFNLKRYIKVYKENPTNPQKYLILYDIQKYLKNINFTF